MRSEYGTHSLRRTKASIIYGRPETFVPSRSCSVIASRKHNALSWDRRGRRACPRGEYRNLSRWLLASGEGPLHGAWDLVAIGRALVVRQGSRKPVSRDTTFVERPLGASLLVGRGSDREWYGYMSALKEAPTPRPFDCAPLDVRGLIAGALHDMPHRLVPSDWRLPDIPRGRHGMADEGRQPAPNRQRSSAPFRAPRRTLKIP